MIDFHSHILPGIDDGSKSVKESLSLLAELKKQRVTTVVATPHYYISQRSPQRFLEKRAHAFAQLEEQLPDNSPAIILGAEVLYFPGISRMDAVHELCIEGTDVLLLEMPFRGWTEYMVQEIESLAISGGYTVVLAHMERYLRFVKRPVLDRLLDDGVFMQSNADFFLEFLSKRKALRLLMDGYIQLLGSDCHNMTSRPPRLQEAAGVIREALGASILREIDRRAAALLDL